MNIINDRELAFVNVLSWVLGLLGVAVFLAAPLLYSLGVIPGLTAWVLIATGWLLTRMAISCGHEVQEYVKKRAEGEVVSQ